MTEAGLLMAPSGLFMYLFSSVGARISAARGPRTSLAVGIAVIALGYVSALVLRGAAWEIALATAIIGTGVGVAYAAMPALIMGAVPITETAAANGLNAPDALGRHLAVVGGGQRPARPPRAEARLDPAADRARIHPGPARLGRRRGGRAAARPWPSPGPQPSRVEPVAEEVPTAA